MNSSLLSDLSSTSLGTLAQALRHGSLAYDVSETSIGQVLPSAPASVIAELTRLSEEEQWSASQIAYLLESLRHSKLEAPNLEHLFEIVLSGPKSEAVPTRDTQAVFKELIAAAQSEVILASYAIYNGRELFSSLIEKHESIPDFKTTFYLDIPRKRGDSTLSSQIVSQYRDEFFAKQWPSEKRPELHYLSNSLDMDWKVRSSMHAKLIIIDRTTVMISSANLTQAAQTKNIEAGVIVSNKNTAQRLANHFESLAENGSFCGL